MAYRKVLIHGETADQIDDDSRYLEVRTDAASIVLHNEDDETYIEIGLEPAEALALIAALTEALTDLL